VAQHAVPPADVIVLPHVVAAQVELQAKFEGGLSYFSLDELTSRRFQFGFDMVNLHRPTM
jgi:hypothetical protein